MGIIILLLAGLLLITIDSTFAATARTNVLLIVVDDLNVDLGAYGHPIVKTPNIDRIAARGVRFDRAYCQFPLCSPSRNSFLSGYRPETSGVIQQDLQMRAARPEVVFLPEVFKNNGYTSAGAGKVFHRNDKQSWSEYEEGQPKSPQEIAALAGRSKARQEGSNGPEWYRLDCGDEDTGDGIVASAAVASMERAAKSNKPFFVAAGFRKPHLPWTAPARYFELYPASKITIPFEPTMTGIPRIALLTDISGTPMPASRAEAMAGYYACISFVDTQVGQLLDSLDRLKLWDNTVVIFFADHGYHLGDHGLWCKLTTFERSARVPLIIAPPRSPNAGKSSRGIVELIDVYPTLTELCGLQNPARLEGKSLVPLLKNPAAEWTNAAYTVTVHEGVLGRSVRTENWRYTEWDDGRSGSELYDHRVDPGEYQNLVNEAKFKGEVESLRKTLAAIPKFTGKPPADAQSPRKAKKK